MASNRQIKATLGIDVNVNMDNAKRALAGLNGNLTRSIKGGSLNDRSIANYSDKATSIVNGTKLEARRFYKNYGVDEKSQTINYLEQRALDRMELEGRKSKNSTSYSTLDSISESNPTLKRLKQIAARGSRHRIAGMISGVGKAELIRYDANTKRGVLGIAQNFAQNKSLVEDEIQLIDERGKDVKKRLRNFRIDKRENDRRERLKKIKDRQEGKFEGFYNDFTKYKTKDQQDRYLNKFIDPTTGKINPLVANAHNLQESQIQRLLDASNGGQSAQKKGGMADRISLIFLGRAIGQSIVQYASARSAGFNASFAQNLGGLSTTNGIGLTENSIKAQSVLRMHNRQANIGAIGAAVGGVAGSLAGSLFAMPIAGAAVGMGMGSSGANSLVELYAGLTGQPNLSPMMTNAKYNAVSEQYTRTENARNLNAQSNSRLMRMNMTTNMGKRGDFESMGMSDIDVSDFAYNFRRTNPKNIHGLLALNKGYGLDGGQMGDFLYQNKFTKANTSSIYKILGNASSKGVSAANYDKALERYSNFSGLLGSHMSNVGVGQTQSLSNYFSNLGGAFNMTDPRSVERANKMYSSFSNPQSDFAKAGMFMAAQRTNPNGSLSDIVRSMDSPQAGEMKEFLRFYKQSGVSKDIGVLGLRNMFGMSIDDARSYWDNGQTASTASGKGLSTKATRERANNFTTNAERTAANLTNADLSSVLDALNARNELIEKAVLLFENVAPGFETVEEKVGRIENSRRQLVAQYDIKKAVMQNGVR